MCLCLGACLCKSTIGGDNFPRLNQDNVEENSLAVNYLKFYSLTIPVGYKNRHISQPGAVLIKNKKMYELYETSHPVITALLCRSKTVFNLSCSRSETHLVFTLEQIFTAVSETVRKKERETLLLDSRSIKNTDKQTNT